MRRKAARVSGRKSASRGQARGSQQSFGSGITLKSPEHYGGLLAFDQGARRGRGGVPSRRACSRISGRAPGCRSAGRGRRRGGRAGDGGLDPAGLLVAVVAGQAAADVLERQPREDRDAVEALLSMGFNVVAHLLDLEPGELVVGRLELLQHHHVGSGVAQPVEQGGQPGLDAVDVEGGDLHGPDPRGAPREAASGDLEPVWKASGTQ